MDIEACPFCGNTYMLVHHSESNITFLLCGDDVGHGGCGAVVSFRPNLTGSSAIAAYNQRTQKAAA